ncbi:MAG: hypothetical protein A2176_00440 [Spirochaetes bacterium RBG_13_51_14]|nr:MAG: hypothetical protein A2176_00440 [Spirochaetes bacterium RBG_13_51_14]
MKTVCLAAVLAVALASACVTLGGKWSESKIDEASEKCFAENDALKPPTARWYNLGTQERTKKKKELDEYRKKRIELYQHIYNFKSGYLTRVDSDGKCRKKECASLEKIRELIIEGCPEAGASFPSVAPDEV